MRILLTAAMFLACALGMGHSLQCYTCAGGVLDSECQEISNCSSSQSHCRTNVIKFLSFTMVNKFCSDDCSSSINVSNSLISDRDFCCQSNLCNNRTVRDLLNSGNSQRGLTNSIVLLLAMCVFVSAALAMGI
ncbi:prostate stem cell antigen-like [Discoglossus pictus]